VFRMVEVVGAGARAVAAAVPSGVDATMAAGEEDDGLFSLLFGGGSCGLEEGTEPPTM
jgi:hypothetical protein